MKHSVISLCWYGLKGICFILSVMIQQFVAQSVPVVVIGCSFKLSYSTLVTRNEGRKGPTCILNTRKPADEDLAWISHVIFTTAPSSKQ